MSLDAALQAHSLAVARASHRGALARESGDKRDWEQYRQALVELSEALAVLDQHHRAQQKV
jgi:hypothetical protein